MAQQSTYDPMRRSRQERYIVLCEGQDSVTINYLAEALGVTYDVALADVRDMVASGRIGMQAYIDYYSKRLVLRSKAGDWSAWANFAGQTAETVRSAVNDSLNRAAATMAENRRKQAASNSGRTTYTNPQTQSRARQSSASAPKRDKAIKSVFAGRRFYSLIGGIGCLTVSALGLIGSLEELAWFTFAEYIAFNFAPLLLLVVIGALGVGLLAWRSNLKKQMIRFETYRAMLSGKDDMELSALANAAGVKPSRARKDVEEMISKGLLGSTAFYDVGSRRVVIRGGAPKQQPEKREAKREEKPAEEPAKDDSEYMTILREIRQLDEDIADEPVSEQIRRIESLTAKIFRVVEEKPEKQPQIRSFMSYYLPTTLKLLRNYSFLERQGVDGENISAAKKNISEMLTKLESSFVQQLDQLFKSEALDISTDVDVLESMMKRDGLTDEGFRAQGSN